MNKKFTYIGTWRMAFFGLNNSFEKKIDNATDFVVNSIKEIENYELFKSVGYGGLPNEDGIVELDASFMDGDTFNYGSIISIQNYKNPILLAHKLAFNKYNRILSGKGAEKFAEQNNFKKDNLLTEKARKTYFEKKKEIIDKGIINPYDGHDTVCVLGIDDSKKIVSGASTSGLFMKKAGRVGDSPLPGSGYWADSNIGAAAATGLGEDIARGVLSKEVVNQMEFGLSPQKAADKVLFMFIHKMKDRGIDIGSISLIAINKNYEWGVSTNCSFQFSVYDSENAKPKLYVSEPNKNMTKSIFIEAEEGYWEEYFESLK